MAVPQGPISANFENPLASKCMKMVNTNLGPLKSMLTDKNFLNAQLESTLGTSRSFLADCLATPVNCPDCSCSSCKCDVCQPCKLPIPKIAVMFVAGVTLGVLLTLIVK